MRMQKALLGSEPRDGPALVLERQQQEPPLQRQELVRVLRQA
jgi:hypothetical protein